MEQLSGVSNWRLTIRREQDGITLLQAKTCDKRAILPDTLFGLPVKALGHHALTPNAAPVAGDEVTITCGPGGESWDNTALTELTLPGTLRRIGDYAFLNCRALQSLHIHDNIQYWGGGALINCPSLAKLHIIWDEKQDDVLSYFADELSRELDVTVDAPDGRFKLVLPEYVELYEENCPARVFDYNIQGAGYPYHHCFRNRKLNFQEYDALWKGYLSMEYEESTAMRLAWYRLRYPVELGEKAEADYRAYLQEHVTEVIPWLMTEGTASDIATLLRWIEPSREELSAMCALAREKGETEALAVLLEVQNRRFSRKKTFEL